jgi:predicted dehydrogenase
MGFTQNWPRPEKARPIVIIGAGGIVVDSHMPAYRQAGYEVAGIYNRSRDRAESVAEKFGIPKVFGSIEEVAAQKDVIFDLASSHHVHADMLEKLPDGAPVLIQKPLGVDLAEASRILEICRRKSLTAAVNFQLRYAPMMLAVRDAMAKGFFGQMTEIEVHLNLVTPWHLFPTLERDPRVEIVSHSIHYIDLIQSLVGLPKGVVSRNYSYPGSKLTDTRTTAILEYDYDLRVALSINHHHDFGRSHQDSSIRFEGNEGAAVVKLGVLLDYPHGEADELWMGKRGGSMEQVPLTGHWFPDAFEMIMNNMQRFVSGEDDVLMTNVESAWQTMAIVEACYASAERPLEPVPDLPKGAS